MDIDFGLIDRIAQGPQWIYWWTRVIDASNWLLVLFAFSDSRVRWALLAWVCNIVMIITLFNLFGYTKILGLSHILAWVPLLIYLWSRRQPFSDESAAGKYLYWFMLVISISLVFDFVDVAKYFISTAGA